jgi:hypothetical protein
MFNLKKVLVQANDRIVLINMREESVSVALNQVFEIEDPAYAECRVDSSEFCVSMVSIVILWKLELASHFRLIESEVSFQE